MASNFTAMIKMLGNRRQHLNKPVKSTDECRDNLMGTVAKWTFDWHSTNGMICGANIQTSQVRQLRATVFVTIGKCTVEGTSSRFANALSLPTVFTSFIISRLWPHGFELALSFLSSPFLCFLSILLVGGTGIAGKADLFVHESIFDISPSWFYSSKS
jgi:hypothetical protein